MGCTGIHDSRVQQANLPLFDECADKVLLPSEQASTLSIEDPEHMACPDGNSIEHIGPNDIDPQNLEFESMSLQHCIELALQNSKLLRDLGGSILRAPNSVESVYDPAIVYSDPRFGEEASLSAFDPNFRASAVFDNNDRVLNNRFFGEDGFVKQDLGNYVWELSKRSVTGGQFSFKHATEYDFNNQLGNRFGTPSATWDSIIEGEVRQPLLQGGGVKFNRIAGTAELPGTLNGILLARTNTDISLAEFEKSVREFLSNIENAYWDLYYAYRSLDAKIEARDRSLATWRIVKAKSGSQEGSSEGGTADKEGQAREQYFRFQAEIVRALNGRLVDGTQSFNGSAGGTFRGSGVRVAERKLRLLLGLPINSGLLIRPQDVPLHAPLFFEWGNCANEALVNRPELRQQRWLIKQKELELLANKNFLLPRLDAFARYRVRGFGNELLGDAGKFSPGDTQATSITDLIAGDRQEWQMGMELSIPMGYRRQHQAVRNSELQLLRERAVLKAQSRDVIYGLSNAIGEVKAAYETMLAVYNRLEAARDQATAVAVNYERDAAPLDLVLEAQRRVVDATVQFYQSQVEYNLAIKNVHFEKGTLLEYFNVQLQESLSPQKAYLDRLALADQIEFISDRDQDYVLSSGPRVEQIILGGSQYPAAPEPWVNPDQPSPPTNSADSNTDEAASNDSSEDESETDQDSEIPDPIKNILDSGEAKKKDSDDDEVTLPVNPILDDPDDIQNKIESNDRPNFDGLKKQSSSRRNKVHQLPLRRVAQKDPSGVIPASATETQSSNRRKKR